MSNISAADLGSVSLNEQRPIPVISPALRRITALIVALLTAFVSFVFLPWQAAIGVTAGMALLLSLCVCSCPPRAQRDIQQEVVVGDQPPVIVHQQPSIIVHRQQPPIVILEEPPVQRRGFFSNLFRRRVVVDSRPRESMGTGNLNPPSRGTVCTPSQADREVVAEGLQHSSSRFAMRMPASPIGAMSSSPDHIPLERMHAAPAMATLMTARSPLERMHPTPALGGERNVVGLSGGGRRN
ncbi:MAG TPA: hypothetical protein VLE89_06725 [Chlamydiales bacterium]|nr:hypothetical protein [Chlamydiales bacterium]